MTKPRRGTSFLIHARPGGGKSTLLHTTPGPRLIVDAEAGDDEFEADVEVLKWDDFVDANEDPALLTPKTSVVIDARTYADYQLGMRIIREDVRTRRFRSFCLDTITRIQSKMEEELLPLNRSALKARGRNFEHFDQLLNYMRADLEYLHEQTIERGLVTAWACQSDKEMNPITPRLLGQLRKSIPDIPDIVGFLRAEEGADTDGKAVTWWEMDISSAEGSLAEAKCRRRLVAKKWGKVIPHPNLKE
ncbi:MAG: AAA family ATPase, partial [bacterium]|nr:AAA family ATPase [bacterium]